MSIATDIIQRVDQNSGTIVTYKEETEWYDGTLLDDSKIDNDIFNKKGDKYYKKQIEKETILKIKNVSELRVTNGYYEGQEISLLGYYTTGDKPLINYIFTVQDLENLVDDGGSIIKTERGAWIAQLDKEINVLHFGAIKDFSDYSNNSFRKAISYINSKGGGTLYVPAGQYKLFRELETIQLPRINNAMFILGDNFTIKGDGKDLSKVLFECPKQGKTDLDRNFYYCFFSHQKNFTCYNIEIMGNIVGDEFEFEPFKPPQYEDGGIFIGTGSDGGYYTSNSHIYNCRLGGTRGFLYATSIISGCSFHNNEVLYSNGFNVNGNKVYCNDNFWKWSELMESACEIPFSQEAIDLGFSNIAFIEFRGNKCFETYGLSVGGYYNGGEGSKSYGYDVSNNIMINKEYSTTTNAAINIVNNAFNVNVSNNIVKGGFAKALNINGTSQFGDAGYVNVIGGVYETNTSNAVQISVDSGIININGVHIKCINSAIYSGLGVNARLNIGAGCCLEAGRGMEIDYACQGSVNVSKDINYIRTIPGIFLDTIGGVQDSAVNTLSYTPVSIISKNVTDSSKLLEYAKVQGGVQGDEKFSTFFVRYANGRIGWGDETRSYNEIAGVQSPNIDVYLSRKAPNTLGVDDGDSLRVGKTTTLDRPDPTVMGAGAIMFDTTLSKFIGSNGTDWIEL